MALIFSNESNVISLQVLPCECKRMIAVIMRFTSLCESIKRDKNRTSAPSDVSRDHDNVMCANS